MRDTLIAKYPEIMATDNSGYMPNNAMYHAEATTLLRAAQANGGTLRGRELDIFVDNRVCNNCRDVLPLLTPELGQPIVRITDQNGRQTTIKNGRVIGSE